MEWYKVVLLILLAAIVVAFVTGHKKVAMGLTSFTVTAIVAFFAAIIIALRHWGGK
jgi:Flp pilus assembly protein protease CpaA